MAVMMMLLWLIFMANFLLAASYYRVMNSSDYENEVNKTYKFISHYYDKFEILSANTYVSQHSCIQNKMSELNNARFSIRAPYAQNKARSPQDESNICGLMYVAASEAICGVNHHFFELSFQKATIPQLALAAVNNVVYFVSVSVPEDNTELIDFHSNRLTWSFQKYVSNQTCPIFFVYSKRDLDIFSGRYCYNQSIAILVPEFAPWKQLDSQRHTDHNKYVLARMIISSGYTAAFLDTDVWFEASAVPTTSLSTFDIAIKSLSPDPFYRSIDKKHACEMAHAANTGAPCLQRPNFAYCCICSCIMFFNPTSPSKMFLNNIIKVLAVDPFIWEQDLTGRLLPLHVYLGLNLYDLDESYSMENNITIYANGGFGHPNPFHNSLIYHSGIKVIAPPGFCRDTGLIYEKLKIC